MGDLKPKNIQGQPSWQFTLDAVTAAVTQLGGHLAPVRFRLPHATVEPLAVAPWAAEKLAADTAPVLRPLRGDFFCAPFGGNATPYLREKHPAHGETATRSWKFVSLAEHQNATVLHLSQRAKIRKGCVDKFVRLRRGETAIYQRHVLSRMSGRMCYGHHPVLKFPDAPASGLISTSPISYGQVFPAAFENPAGRGYQSLKRGAEFSRLDRVPALDGSLADLTSYPARRGFDDLALIVHRAAADFAWTAVVFPKERYVWFALKDPRVLTATVLWLSNGGRYYAPWNGQHLGRLGIEDVTAYFDFGLAESARENPLSKRGVATSVELKPFAPLVVNHIMAVAPVPAGWGAVKSITRTSSGVTLHPARGKDVFAPLDVDHLYSPADDFVAC